MIKEIPRSLEQYIGIVGVASIILGILGITMNKTSPVVVGLSSVTVAFGFIYLIIAIRLKRYFPEKAGFIKKVLTANLAFRVLQFLLLYALIGKWVGPYQLGITVIIYIYLVRNIDRLVHEGTQIA